MAHSIYDIITKFPTDALPKIDGEPTYATINILTKCVYGNAATLPTTLGRGNLGHIGFVMRPGLYATISPVPFVMPPNPGPAAVIPHGTATAAREQMRDDHKEERRIYDNIVNCDNACKKQVLNAVDETYTIELNNRYTGYFGVTTRDILDHLLLNHGKITSTDLKTNQDTFQAAMDPSQPIAIYFKAIDDCIEYADDANTPYSREQIVNTVYLGVFSSGFYNEACKEWQRKPEVDKTWLNFKTFFGREYRDLREQQRVTSGTSGFHSANALEDISVVLDNLANAAIADKAQFDQLLKSIETLTTTNKTLTEQLRVANASLLKQKGTNPTNPTTTKGKGAWDREAWLKSLDPMGYCWSHGYKVVKDHNSKNCVDKRQGHEDTATRADTMGGSTRNKDWKPE